MASLFEESRAYAADLMAVTGRQAYFLEVPGAASAAELSVVSFEATERMGAPTEVRIQLTHPGKLAREDYLNRDAAFLIDPPPRHATPLLRLHRVALDTQGDEGLHPLRSHR